MEKSLVAYPVSQAEKLPDEDPCLPSAGKWYWVNGEKERWLGCAVHVGSNYVCMKRAETGTSTRIHLDEFPGKCEAELDPDSHIDKTILGLQRKASALLKEVKSLTASLCLANHPGLPQRSEVHALALRTGQPVDEYKASLVQAQNKTLPKLFDDIKKVNSLMGGWMRAKLIPLDAQIGAMSEISGAIANRIFSVELYAGLSEQVEQIRDGDPAQLGEKIRLMQRRHYMDEECLANYRTGGMDFKGLGDFDRWLAEDENMERILPFPRCIVAFQVRRRDKEREIRNLIDYFRMADAEKMDKLTYLYIRNGDQLYRLSTLIDFGPRLFPDMGEDPIVGRGKGKIYARTYGLGIISEERYLEMIEEEARRPSDESWRGRESEGYAPFDNSNVYYDDILKHIQEKMNQHNRLVLVLQGLLDRSPVLLPHPPWHLWDPDGFDSSIEPVYDDSRALTPGAAPDFEEYRRKCNAQLRSGSVTVGQEDEWEVHEAKKESDRMDRDYRDRGDWRPKRFRPYGDPGPGTLATVEKWSPQSELCTYAWARDKKHGGEIRRTFTCSSSRVLNVDAYKPGDFKIFFGDPRTRADYLQWAPLLLEAEEYHAGNRELKPIPAKTPQKSSADGKARYAMRKERKRLTGKTVVLSRPVQMENGAVYLDGTRWKIMGGQGTTFNLREVLKDGSLGDKRIRSLWRYYFEEESA